MLDIAAVGASEMVGCVLFRAMRDKGVELFADEPAVAERIRLLYNEDGQLWRYRERDLVAGHLEQRDVPEQGA